LVAQLELAGKVNLRYRLIARGAATMSVEQKASPTQLKSSFPTAIEAIYD